ncbi:TPA: STAS domain-containing protein [Clostridioides difficile]|uniref:STAS domain-containing protein n=1 Tax=Clostridioides difficile TaxID=1496 RepID=UPI00038CB01E|nr:STAS domain-containing protein [Clostridioides difficile]AXU25984.1 anti-sigma-B factor antagonist [Clostridioides difficile]AXU29752.1 anti-sigma-B factor antagonist [Clostridioides difficile]AXU33540.1 anti-sigma-B factor antagonist [Clostridioides difficile]EQE82612.1 anti-sigma-B factor antagonist [Clostridioides difficile CD69]KJF61678.1 anti-sigma factor antagonist [Clostridioides difficile]
MSMNIDSNLDSQNKFWNVCLDGELDVSTADKLKEHLHGLIEKNMLDVKINLKDLDYIDSTGLGAMIGVLKKLKINEKEIYIVNPKSNVRKIFTITGLDKIFKVEG